MVNPFNLKKIDTRFRTNDSEIMDDFQLEGTELEQALDKIAKINQLLGGNKLTENRPLFRNRLCEILCLFFSN